MKKTTGFAAMIFGLMLCFAANSSLGEEAAQASGSKSKQSQSAKSSMALVDPAWVAEHLQKPDVRVLEVGMRDQYDKGHIDQAVFVDWVKGITDPVFRDRYNILPREQMEQLLSQLGIHKNTTVVLYDQLQNRLSTRMFWMLRYYGHQNVKVLNGGGKAWLASGREFTNAQPTVAKTNYTIEKIEAGLRADRDFIRSHLKMSDFVLVDGRPMGQYTGKLPGKVYHTGKEHARRGHIPQAVNIPWKENLTKTGQFKSIPELEKLYKDHGVTKETSVVTYCNEGLHAAHPWFVLTELLGYEQVRLYDDSLSEWANTPNDPLEVGEQK